MHILSIPSNKNTLSGIFVYFLDEMRGMQDFCDQDVRIVRRVEQKSCITKQIAKKETKLPREVSKSLVSLRHSVCIVLLLYR